MNSYVSDPCWVYKLYGHRWRRWGGWMDDSDDCERDLVPGSNPQNLDTFFFATSHFATILAKIEEIWFQNGAI